MGVKAIDNWQFHHCPLPAGNEIRRLDLFYRRSHTLSLETQLLASRDKPIVIGSDRFNFDGSGGQQILGSIQLYLCGITQRLLVLKQLKASVHVNFRQRITNRQIVLSTCLISIGVFEFQIDFEFVDLPLQGFLT